jgi:hypothetical protein
MSWGCPESPVDAIIVAWFCVRRDGLEHDHRTDHVGV